MKKKYRVAFMAIFKTACGYPSGIIEHVEADNTTQAIYKACQKYKNISELTVEEET